MKRYIPSILLILLNTNAFAQVIPIINSHTYESIKQKYIAVVDCYTNSCGYCTIIKTPYEEVSSEAAFKDVTFASVNLEEFAQPGTEWGVRGLPTIVILKNGQPVDRLIGVKSVESFTQDLKEKISNALQSSDNNNAEEKQIISSQENSSSPNCSLCSKAWEYVYSLFAAITQWFERIWNYIRSKF